MEVVTSVQKPYQERENAWCWSVPPRCTKFRIKSRWVNETEYQKKERIVKECCGKIDIHITSIIDNFDIFRYVLAGYGKNIEGNRCIPVCTDCQHGACVAPDVCKCDHGYGGPACDISKSFSILYYTTEINYNFLLSNRLSSRLLGPRLQEQVCVQK